ncbi:hypothetical protein D3C86_1337270 [compost metagenome]
MVGQEGVPVEIGVAVAPRFISSGATNIDASVSPSGLVFGGLVILPIMAFLDTQTCCTMERTEQGATLQQKTLEFFFSFPEKLFHRQVNSYGSKSLVSFFEPTFGRENSKHVIAGMLQTEARHALEFDAIHRAGVHYVVSIVAESHLGERANDHALVFTISPFQLIAVKLMV